MTPLCRAVSGHFACRPKMRPVCNAVSCSIIIDFRHLATKPETLTMIVRTVEYVLIGRIPFVQPGLGFSPKTGFSLHVPMLCVVWL